MPRSDQTATVFLGLGSNLGDRRPAMCAAIHSLVEHPHIDPDHDRGVASLYETSPVGGPPGQGPYLNSAVRITTSLSPQDLLHALQAIETKIGRVRHQRWAPRVIDMDILLFNDLVLDDSTLSIPHPRMHERLFVLAPLSEIAGELVHPTRGQTIARLTTECRIVGSIESVVRVEGHEWYAETVTQHTSTAP